MNNLCASREARINQHHIASAHDGDFCVNTEKSLFRQFLNLKINSLRIKAINWFSLSFMVALQASQVDV